MVNLWAIVQDVTQQCAAFSGLRRAAARTSHSFVSFSRDTNEDIASLPMPNLSMNDLTYSSEDIVVCGVSCGCGAGAVRVCGCAGAVFCCCCGRVGADFFSLPSLRSVGASTTRSPSSNSSANAVP